MLRPKDLCQGSGTKTFLEAMNSGKVHLARFVLDALDCRIINSKNESSRTPLMCAVCLQEHSTRSKFTQLLLEKGADVNTKDENGRTALSLACELGHLDAVKLLVQFNANPELTDTWGNSALMYAAYGGHSQILDFLIRAFKRLGLRLDHSNHAGHTAIQVAENLGHANCVQVLSIAVKKAVSIEQTQEIRSGSHAVPWPNRLPKQILEKFSKPGHSKNEETLPSLFHRQMLISDGKDLKRRFSQQQSPERTNSSGYQSLTRFPERRFTEKEQHVLFSSKQFQYSREAGFVRKNTLVSERCQKVDHHETRENPPQWGKEAKSFNLDLKTGRKQSYQGETRDVTQPVSQLKRASLPDARPLVPKFYCHGNTSAKKSDVDRAGFQQMNGVSRVTAEQRNSDYSEKKKSSLKRGGVVKNERANKLLFSRDEAPRERIKIRPPGFGTRLLRRFTAPEFMGLVRDAQSGATSNKGKIARSETFPLSYTHKLVNSQPSVDSISGVRCEFEGSPPVSRA
ncbi:ankyrin repeat domain-containing protein 50 [Ictalurus furcatus]|uniref:ankyrin repeat domain-containing protein 50 n=1 Tax=Ictalurus furcatus TaxID=66913 RepID=UPI00235051FF|nr:ankyrin repeat domain-containing protein 50 [Ictalurus furcatus]